MRRGITSSRRACAKAERRWLKTDGTLDAEPGRCADCRFFVPSCGAFEGEVGACAGAGSARDGSMVRGVDGCAAFAAQDPEPAFRSRDFASEVHRRWISEDYRTGEDQCGGCAYFIPLGGAFVSDWGTCANKDSDRDGLAQFEHASCECFERNALGWGGATPRALIENRPKGE